MQPIFPGESVSADGVGDPQTWASFDTPAYVRRGLTVEVEWRSLCDKLQHTWDEWTVPVGRLCSQLRHQAEGWAPFKPWLASEEDLERLHRLDERLNYRLKYPPPKATWLWTLKGPLKRLARMVPAFNEVWGRHLATLDLDPLNRAREQYNRWYLLEKECAMRSTRSATGGFETIPSATVGDLAAAFPPLPGFSLR